MTGPEAKGRRRARGCQEQTKVKEEQWEAASGPPCGVGGSHKCCYGWGRDLGAAWPVFDFLFKWGQGEENLA